MPGKRRIILGAIQRQCTLGLLTDIRVVTTVGIGVKKKEVSHEEISESILKGSWQDQNCAEF